MLTSTFAFFYILRMHRVPVVFAKKMLLGAKHLLEGRIHKTVVAGQVNSNKVVGL